MQTIPAAPPTERTLSIAQAAAAASVTPRTIYNWMACGKLPYKRLPSGTVRIQPSDMWREDFVGLSVGSQAFRRETPRPMRQA